MTTAEQLAALALQVGALKINPGTPFRWASGALMPVYNDNRLLLRYPRGRELVRRGLQELVRGDADGVDVKTGGGAGGGGAAVIAGVATGGIVPAALLADALGLEMVYVRPAAKEHGLKRSIEGDSGAGLGGTAVVLVEDLISTGGSSVAAALALIDAGAQIVQSLGIFSYGFSVAEARFREAGIPPFRTILTFPTLLEVARNENYLNEEELMEIENWQRDPFGWGAGR